MMMLDADDVQMISGYSGFDVKRDRIPRMVPKRKVGEERWVNGE